MRWESFAACVLAFCASQSGIAISAHERLTLLAHRGVAQDYDRSGLTQTTCTASRMLPPTHAYLENTLDSIRAAFAFGADVVEFDIHPTTDGEFVVFHDWTVDCRTNGFGVTREQSLAYLKSLDIGYGYTADGGATYPFRGKFVGAMPTWPEVMAEFPGRRFLVNVKSNSSAEGVRIVAYLREKGIDTTKLMFYGGDNPVAVLRRELKGTRTLSRQNTRSCMLPYLFLGWAGYMPAACRDSVIFVPVNYQGAIWGWPERFLERMAAINSEVFVVGPLTADTKVAGITALDDPASIAALPAGFAGGISTDKIEIIGPALKRGLERRP